MKVIPKDKYINVDGRVLELISNIIVRMLVNVGKKTRDAMTQRI